MNTCVNDKLFPHNSNVLATIFAQDSLIMSIQ